MIDGQYESEYCDASTFSESDYVSESGSVSGSSENQGQGVGTQYEAFR